MREHVSGHSSPSHRGVAAVVRRLLGLLGLLGLLELALPATAAAMVTEPPIAGATTGETVPKPSGSAEIGVVTARGFSSAAGTLQGLFASRGETIDYVKDARTTPGTFSLSCGLTGQIVLKAGGCKSALGWYNATAGATTPPPKNEIYELVPASFPMCPAVIDPTTSCCDDQDFCPLASYDTTQTPNHRWNMAPFSGAGILADAHYAGGLIGFALVGDSSSQCTQTKYAQLELNQKSPSGEAWVGAVVYQSTIEPSSYYLAFESLPTTTQSWKGPNNGNDGDFNDLVVYIKGACADPGSGLGGAAGGAGTAGATGNAGQGGSVTAGGGRGAAGRDQPAAGGAGGRGGDGGRGGANTSAASGGRSERGGAGGISDGGATGSGGDGSGGATASGGDGGRGVGGGAGVPPSGSGGASATSSASSSCTCAIGWDEGTEGPLAAGLLLAATACQRRRRRARPSERRRPQA